MSNAKLGDLGDAIFTTAADDKLIPVNDDAKYWPIGTVVVSNTGFITVQKDFARWERDVSREASEAEIKMLRSIPEMAKAMEAGK